MKILIEVDGFLFPKKGDVYEVEYTDGNNFCVKDNDGDLRSILKSHASLLIEPWEATKAVQEGRAVQIWAPSSKKWETINDYPIIAIKGIYRLTPEPPKPKFVPFTHEDWEVFTKKPVRFKSWTLPFFSFIESFSNKKIGLKNGLTIRSVSYTEAFEKLEFIDGAPFGKEVSQ